MAANERDWVIEPSTARVDIAIGNEASISPELRSALEQLAQVMAQDDEVSGYAVKIECTDVVTTLCDINVSCARVIYTHTDS